MNNTCMVTKKFHFCAAHRLIRHSGRCKNLHGHNYAVTVAVSGKKDAETNMVKDFGVIKDLLGPEVDVLDHSIILNEEDELLECKDFIRIVGRKNIHIWGGDPTAESMASYFSHIFKGRLEDAFPSSVFVLTVEVEETPGNSAIF